MRYSLVCLLMLPCLGLWSGEVETPKVVLDQLEILRPDFDKAKAEYGKKLTTINNKLITTIQSAMAKETRAGKLDNALALKAALEKARAGEYVNEILNQAPADLLGDDEPGIYLTPGKYTLSGKCDDHATVYVAGKNVLECSAGEVQAEIQVQGRFSMLVKCEDGGGARGLSLRLVDAANKVVVSTQVDGKWKSYAPTDEARWWMVDSATKFSATVAGDCSWRIADAIPIWAADTPAVCYLTFGR